MTPNDLGILKSAATLLFVPGDRPDRFERASASGADLVVLDLEDAVSPEHKERAREHVVHRCAEKVPTVVRINAAGTRWHDADVEALCDFPVIVMIPKAENAAAIRLVVDSLHPSSKIIALIESGAGVVAAASIASTTGVERLALGNLDLSADLGVDPTHSPIMDWVRSALVVASAAGGISGPIDGVTVTLDSPPTLIAETRSARALGFTGKLCVHPKQVADVAQCLAPDDAQVAWAHRVLESSRGDQLSVVDGQMVDPPVLLRARDILRRSWRPSATVFNEEAT